MNHYAEDADEDREDVNDVYPVLAADQYEQNIGDWNIVCSGMTPKIPPMYDGRTSWFQYEELIDDWLDMTSIDQDKQGPALKYRLQGDAAVYKSLLDRNHLKTANGVRYFKDTLRPNFVKGNQSVFLWRFFQLVRTHRGNMDFVKWIGRFTVSQKRLFESWMDLMPEYNKQSQKYLNEVMAESQRQGGRTYRSRQRSGVREMART